MRQQHIPTGIIAALPAEARAARALQRKGWQVSIAGVGAANARSTAQSLIDKGAERLLIWGVAGALHPDLRTADVIIPTEAVDEQDNRYPVTEQWRAHILACISDTTHAATGALATTSRPVPDQQAKQALAQRTGAVAVDMEAAAVGRLAQENNVPFAVVRAITDPLEQALPQAVVRARPGRHFASEVALRLAGRPWDLPGVVSLGRNMRLAQRSLTSTAHRLVERESRCI